MPSLQNPCKFCGEAHPGHCPHVKRIFKLEDGSVRRVEFFPYTPAPVEYTDVVSCNAEPSPATLFSQHWAR
jgi:hypothetical protein